MQRVILTEEQKREFALNALKARKGLSVEDELIVDDVTIDEMLVALRKEDEGDSLWCVYNVLQEKCINGGFSVSKDGKRARAAKKVKGFISDLFINERLWKMAESYLPKPEPETPEETPDEQEQSEAVTPEAEEVVVPEPVAEVPVKKLRKLRKKAAAEEINVAAEEVVAEA